MREGHTQGGGLSPASGPASPPPGTATPVIIDADPGIDDAVALLLALASPELDVRLVTTVRGNLAVDRCTENALRLLARAGRPEIPVAGGADTALVQPAPEAATHVHGTDGLGGVALAASAVPPDPRHAVVAMADELLGSDRPVTVVAIAPLTNIALLLGVFPAAAERIGRLVVMGGSATGGNASAAAEFNIWADPEAAARVLGAGLPTTLVGLDVTRRTRLFRPDLARIAAGAFPGGRELAEMLEFYLARAEQRYSTPWAVVHDAVTVAAVLRPELIGTVGRRVWVDCSSGPGRGQTLVDRRSAEESTGAVQVAETIDVAGTVGFLLERLGAGPDREPEREPGRGEPLGAAGR